MSDSDDPIAKGYRDDRFGQLAMREAALQHLHAVMSDDRVRNVYARNGALIAAALWLVACFTVMVYGAFAWSGEASRMIVVAWTGAPVVALVGRFIAKRRHAKALRAASERAVDAVHATGDEAARVAFADAGMNRGRAEGVALVAVSLMVPLSLHLVYQKVTGEIPFPLFHSFNEWIRMGVMLVGHSHLALAFMGWQHARRVALADTGHSGVWEGLKALIVSSVLAVFPAVLLLGVAFFIANAIVAVTGLVFVPLAWWWAAGHIRRERAMLEEAVQAQRA